MNKKIKVLLLALGAISLLTVGISVVTYLSSQQQISVHAEQKLDLENQNSYLEQKLESSLQEATHWREKSDEIKVSLTTLAREHTLLSNQFEDMLKRKDALADENKELTDQLGRLSQAYGQTKEEVTVTASDEFLAGILEEKAGLEVEIDKLKSKIGDQKEALKDIEQRRLPFERLQKEKQALEGKLADAEGVSTTLSKDLLKIRKEKTSLETELTRAEERLRALARENDQLGGQLVKMKQALGRRLAELNQTKIILEAAVAGAEKTMAKIEPVAIELPPIIVRAEGKSPLSATGFKVADKPGYSKVASGQSQAELSGRIIKINDKHKFVVVDIGRTDGVEKGMDFDVLRRGKKIGKIKVIETRKNIAACDIKELNARNFKVSDLVSRVK